MKSFSKRYHLPFSVTDVYRNWVSSETVIAPAQAMQVEPKVGGVYRLTMPGGMTMEGAFSEVEPDQRLVYSWQWQGSDEITQIEINFETMEDGTTVHLSHHGFTTQESHDNHAQGWDSYIEGFTQHLQDMLDA